MSITRVNEFIAQTGREDELQEYLASIVPVIEAAEGCLYCQLLQGHDNSARFLIIETWESIAVHQLSVQGIDRKEFMRAMQLLEVTPKAEYFRS